MNKCAENIGCTCLMCEQPYRIKYEYEGMKTAAITDYTSQTPLSISDG